MGEAGKREGDKGADGEQGGGSEGPDRLEDRRQMQDREGPSRGREDKRQEASGMKQKGQVVNCQ